MAKLDPDNAKTAKDVMDENARKRKREDDYHPEIESVVLEEPFRNPKRTRKQAKKLANKQKSEHEVEESGEVAGPAQSGSHVEKLTETSPDAVKISKAERKGERSKARKTKDISKVAKRETKRSSKEQEKRAQEGGQNDSRTDPSMAVICAGAASIDPAGDISRDPVHPHPSPSTATPSPTPQSPVFDNLTAQSGPSSVSSIAPPTKAESPKPGITPDQPAESKPTNKEEIVARLQKILALKRAARNAPRSKSEFQEQCRRREAQRLKKARKKRLLQEEEKQKSGRSSPLLLPFASGSNPASRPTSPPNLFSFSRITFPNGDCVSTADPSQILSAPKKKGPQDAGSALVAAEAKQTRISELDPATQAKIAEQDLWLNARKRAHGEVIRDDASLLKKTLKRKAQAKKKSEREWEERIEGVKAGKAIRGKRRDENIRKRKEEKKGGKGSKKAKPKPKGRPGFEGSFRAGGVGRGK